LKAPSFAWALVAIPFTLPIAEPPHSRAFDPKLDHPARLANGRSLERNLLAIHERGAYSRARALPWSDRIWAFNKGLLGERYTDPAYRRQKGWKAKRDYAAQHGARWVLALPPGSVRDDWIAKLSPVEKYDLLMGTVEGGLYDHLRDYLDAQMDARGRFPTWWGVCEGSAAAGIFYPEPVRVIRVRSRVYQVDIPFYATDIKGLASLLWSTFHPFLRVPEVGLQCRADREAACYDNNPATFHLSLHHLLGMGNGTLFAEMDPSVQAWNYPIVKYELRYFRPDQRRSARSETLDPRAAAVATRDWRRDPRAPRRAPGTAYVVGATVDLLYAKNHRQVPLEGSLDRMTEAKTLAYELELDADWNVLGGEWLSEAHPDVLWTLPRNANADGPGDKLLGSAEWREVAGPAGWEGAARASAKHLVPLRKVVERLIERSATTPIR
jgi:hypothetical protein